ncbi:hypothetical protein B566_EDAN014760 [Ephemera danica]|nr:hypothetical protein B566_EDAN014760 [Ephemera danica]
MCNGGDFTPKKRLRLETNRDTHQALHEALSSKDCGTVCHLLDAGEKLCSTDGIENCFILITKFYNSECLERELTSQPSAIHCRGPQGQTLLMYANQIYTLQTLFKFEPDVNACNDIGENVLIHLIRENTRNYSSLNYMFHRMAEFILYKGIDATTTDQLGKTAIEYVLEFYIRMNSSDPPFPTDDIFKKLLTAGATMPGADSFGRTPAMYFARDSACTTYTFRFILYLLQQGVDPKARDCNRHNLMYFVIRSYFTADLIEYKTVKMKPYTVSCKILLSLLRFWNYPPLTLFIFLYAYDHKNSSFCVLTMLKFLTRVGGRLPPGSPLFKCLMKDLENDPSFDKYIRKQPQFFSKLREEIPSLKELCRPAVRATLSKITTSGLDLSSLRVLCQGELREIPREIQDYLNFKDQPEFCEEDLANK